MRSRRMRRLRLSVGQLRGGQVIRDSQPHQGGALKHYSLLMIVFGSIAEVVCEPPTSPENGYIQGGSSYKAGEVVQFHCHRGFMVEGQPIAVCQDNGKWSGTFPKCSRSNYFPVQLFAIILFFQVFRHAHILERPSVAQFQWSSFTTPSATR